MKQIRFLSQNMFSRSLSSLIVRGKQLTTSLVAASSICGLIASSLSLVAESQAQSLALLSPVESTASDRVGRSISAQGIWMAVGAPFTDLSQADVGAVYVYQVNTFGAVPQARLTASDASIGSNFGAAVSLSGNRIAIGAPGEDRGGLVDAGAVYIFRRVGTSWTEEAKLLPPTQLAGQRFGAAVALAGSHLFVGAPDESARTGAAYRFNVDSGTWLYADKSTPANPILTQRYGYALSTDGNWTSVGMLQNAPEGSDPGRVHMLLNMGASWSDAGTVSPASGFLDDRFGSSTSLWGDTLVVGSMGLSIGAPNNGGAYVFKLVGGTWTESQLLLPEQTQANQFAGHAVAVNQKLSPDTIYIGAPYHDNILADTGAVFQFRRTGMTFAPLTTLRGSNEEASDHFGFSVSSSLWKGGTRIMVGAPQDNARGMNSGAAYISRGVLVALHRAIEACFPPGC